MKITSRIIITLIFLLVSAEAFALTTISSLPYDCNTAGETYVLGSNLTSSSGNAITVSANNVVINGNSKTLTYADTGAGYGILINSNVTSFEVYGLTITQGAYDPAAGERVHAIFRNGNASGVKIHNNTINVNHTGAVANAYGYGINLTNIANTSTGNNIYSNTINVTGTSAGRGISIDTSGSGTFSGSIYGNTVTISNMTSAPAGYPSCITINSTGLIDLYQNTITVASTASIAQGIQFFGTDNSTIRNNTVNLAGVNSRGILIDGGSDNNKVYLNTVTITSQNDSVSHSAGIRVRFGSSNNEIYRNTLTATGSINGYPIRHGEADANGTPQNNVYHHNIITGGGRGISIEGASINTDFYGDTVTMTGSNNPVYIYGVTGQVVNDLVFSHMNISGGGQIVITGATGQTSTVGVVFCSSRVSSANITEGAGVHDWAITSSNCAKVPPSTSSSSFK